MDKRSHYIAEYQKLKQSSGNRKPLLREFLTHCRTNTHNLNKVFGSDPYSKLQLECGDSPNKLELERSSITDILNKYGELVRKKDKIPVSGDWLEAGYTPQPDGLRKVHKLKWSEMSSFFLLKYGNLREWKDVVEILKDNVPVSVSKKQNKTFDEIVQKVIEWTPNRKRVIEEGYKIELRNYLEGYFELEEEVGESNPDILVNKKYPIEIKRDPSQSEYDRLLGQMIRHNKIYGNAIAIITNISTRDRFKKFQRLFTEVHEKLEMTAELIDK